MTGEIIKTIGLRCKACNAELSVSDFDGELCECCLIAVVDANTELYQQIEAKAYKAHERMLRNECEQLLQEA